VTDPKINQCADCGKPTSGTRCAEHNRAFQRLRFLKETAEQDAQVLRWRDDEQLSSEQIAQRLGISRTRAADKVHDARRREKQRQKEKHG
jgi:DNA-directed RNA polymerase specialized sigma24 family protein